MKSFFAAGNTKKKPKTHNTILQKDQVEELSCKVNREQRKSRYLCMSLVVSDNPFGPQPSDGEKIISVQNKCKFLE
jgi:hypothetical protein